MVIENYTGVKSVIDVGYVLNVFMRENVKNIIYIIQRYIKGGLMLEYKTLILNCAKVRCIKHGRFICKMYPAHWSWYSIMKLVEDTGTFFDLDYHNRVCNQITLDKIDYT